MKCPDKVYASNYYRNADDYLIIQESAPPIKSLVGVEFEQAWLDEVEDDYHSDYQFELAPAGWRLETDASLEGGAELISPPTHYPGVMLAIAQYLEDNLGADGSRPCPEGGTHVNVSPAYVDTVAGGIALEDMLFAIGGSVARYKNNYLDDGYAIRQKPYRMGEHEPDAHYRTTSHKSIIARYNRVEIRAFPSSTSLVDRVLFIAMALLLIQQPRVRLPVSASQQEQAKYMVEKAGWHPGGAWKGLWYDPKRPEKVKVRWREADCYERGTSLTMPSERELVDGLLFNVKKWPDIHQVFAQALIRKEAVA